MSLPSLSNWEATKHALHQAAQVVGAIRKLDAAPLPNYQHLALEVTPDGLTSGALSMGGELVLNMRDAALVYTCPEGTVNPVPIAGHTQITLLDAVLETMEKAGHPAHPDRSKITGNSRLEVDPTLSAEYQQALYSIYTAIARFRGRLFGPMSRMVVWPHGFDLSFLWFVRGLDEGSDPHMNFGFSPGSPGLPRPYVYAYAHPKPEGMLEIKLPEPARWNTDPWTGIVIDYDVLAAASNTESMLEQLLLHIHALLAPLLV